MFVGNIKVDDHSQSPKSMAGVDCHEKVLELVNKRLAQPSRIADLAAGEGAFSQILLDLGHEVYAVDATDKKWKLTDTPLHIHDLDSEFSTAITNAEHKFDAVVAIEIIEHLENPFRFVRECAKVLKPGGLFFLTTPNVESVLSRLIFLYAGRLNSFGEYETVRPAHITPIFRWKLEMMLAESNFEILYEGFNRQFFSVGSTPRARIAKLLSRLVAPFTKGDKGGEGRIVLAKLKN